LLLFKFFQDVSGDISHLSIKVFDNMEILYPYTPFLSLFWLDKNQKMVILERSSGTFQYFESTDRARLRVLIK